jgi:hypothetical protein
MRQRRPADQQSARLFLLVMSQAGGLAKTVTDWLWINSTRNLHSAAKIICYRSLPTMNSRLRRPPRDLDQIIYRQKRESLDHGVAEASQLCCRYSDNDPAR